MALSCGHERCQMDCPVCGRYASLLAGGGRRRRMDAAITETNLNKKGQHEPGLLQKALNFGSALVTHIIAGAPQSSQDLLYQRLEICKSCVLGQGGYYDAKRDVCTHPKCGCKMARKARWASMKCPLEKW